MYIYKFAVIETIVKQSFLPELSLKTVSYDASVKLTVLVMSVCLSVRQTKPSA